AHERHRGVRMRVDEARDQDMVRELDRFVIRKPLARVCGGKDCFDLAFVHRQGVVGEHAARRLDRNEPAGESDETLPYRGEPCISTTTRRLGARHSMSALRSFW